MKMQRPAGRSGEIARQRTTLRADEHDEKGKCRRHPNGDNGMSSVRRLAALDLFQSVSICPGLACAVPVKAPRS